MKTLRVKLTSWTGSFRYPGFMIGYQPTLSIPPLSTVYGLISAAKGENVYPSEVSVGYVFQHEGVGEDLETIYELSNDLKGKTNIVRRQFLFNCRLYLYLDDTSYSKYFRKPKYQLVLGRSSDLANVSSINEIELVTKEHGMFGNTIVPFGTENAFGTIQSLPSSFDYSTLPRMARDVSRYLIMDDFADAPDGMPYDPEMNWCVYFHRHSTP